MAASTAGGSFVVGLIGQAGGAVASGPMQVFNQAGNLVYQTGVISWEQSFALLAIDVNTESVHDGVRRIQGIQGDLHSRLFYQSTGVNVAQQGDVRIVQDPGLSHINDQ